MQLHGDRDGGVGWDVQGLAQDGDGVEERRHLVRKAAQTGATGTNNKFGLIYTLYLSDYKLFLPSFSPLDIENAAASTRFHNVH